MESPCCNFCRFIQPKKALFKRAIFSFSGVNLTTSFVSVFFSSLDDILATDSLDTNGAATLSVPFIEPAPKPVKLAKGFPAAAGGAVGAPAIPLKPANGFAVGTEENVASPVLLFLATKRYKIRIVC